MADRPGSASGGQSSPASQQPSSSSSILDSSDDADTTEENYTYDPHNWAGIHFLYMSQYDWVSRVMVNYCAFGIIFFALLWRYRLAQSPAGLMLSLLAAMMFWALQVFFWLTIPGNEGINVAWSGLLGFGMVSMVRTPDRVSIPLLVANVYGFLAMVIFALNSPIIPTACRTAAHLTGILMGVVAPSALITGEKKPLLDIDEYDNQNYITYASLSNWVPIGQYNAPTQPSNQYFRGDACYLPRRKSSGSSFRSWFFGSMRDISSEQPSPQPGPGGAWRLPPESSKVSLRGSVAKSSPGKPVVISHDMKKSCRSFANSIADNSRFSATFDPSRKIKGTLARQVVRQRDHLLKAATYDNPANTDLPGRDPDMLLLPDPANTGEAGLVVSGSNQVSAFQKRSVGHIVCLSKSGARVPSLMKFIPPKNVFVGDRGNLVEVPALEELIQMPEEEVAETLAISAAELHRNWPVFNTKLETALRSALNSASAEHAAFQRADPDHGSLALSGASVFRHPRAILQALARLRTAPHSDKLLARPEFSSYYDEDGNERVVRENDFVDEADGDDVRDFDDDGHVEEDWGTPAAEASRVAWHLTRCAQQGSRTAQELGSILQARLFAPEANGYLSGEISEVAHDLLDGEIADEGGGIMADALISAASIPVQLESAILPMYEASPSLFEHVRPLSVLRLSGDPPWVPFCAKMFLVLLSHKKGPFKGAKGYKTVSQQQLDNHAWMCDEVRQRAFQFYEEFCHYEIKDMGMSKADLTRAADGYLLTVAEKLHALAVMDQLPAIAQRQRDLDNTGDRSFRRRLVRRLYRPEKLTKIPTMAEVERAFGISITKRRPLDPLRPLTSWLYAHVHTRKRSYILTGANLPRFAQLKRMVLNAPLRQRPWVSYLEFFYADPTLPRLAGSLQQQLDSNITPPSFLLFSAEFLERLAAYLLPSLPQLAGRRQQEIGAQQGTSGLLTDGSRDGENSLAGSGPASGQEVVVHEGGRKRNRRGRKSAATAEPEFPPEPIDTTPIQILVVGSAASRLRHHLDEIIAPVQQEMLSSGVPTKMFDFISVHVVPDSESAAAESMPNHVPPLRDPIENLTEEQLQSREEDLAVRLDTVSGCAVFPVHGTMTLNQALSTYRPKIVICSCMPPGLDWSAAFRSAPSVEQYMLLGPRDSDRSGHIWETWGKPMLFQNRSLAPDKGPQARRSFFAKGSATASVKLGRDQAAPYTRGGFVRTDHVGLSRFLLGTDDSPAHTGYNHVTIFSRLWS